jgi:hypothetical protein
MPSCPRSASSAPNADSAATVRELHWLEKLNFAGQFCLVIVGIAAACIYGRQLGVMRGQLNQMVGSSGQTDRLLDLYQQQLAELRRQSSDTHDLAVQAKDQADRTRDLAAAAAEQADATRMIAANAATQAKAASDLASNSAGELATLQKQLELTDRPWIKVTDLRLWDCGSPCSTVTWYPVPAAEQNQMSTGYWVTVKNIGGSTALNVVTFTELYFTGNLMFGLRGEDSRFCDSRGQVSPPVTGRGRTLFPNDPKEDFKSGSANVASANFIPFDRSGPHAYAWVIGCVNYQFQASSTNHQTRFVYGITLVGPQGQPGPLPVGRNLVLSDLKAIRDPSYDYAY